MRLLQEVFQRVGYDLEQPEPLRLKVPRTLAEVETFRQGLRDISYDEESDVRILLSTLICEYQSCQAFLADQSLGAAGATIFVALPNLWVTIFSLGITLLGDIGIVQESSAYIISIFALSLPDIPVRQVLCDYAQSLTTARQGSQYACTALVGIAAQTHVRLNLISWTS